MRRARLLCACAAGWVCIAMSIGMGTATAGSSSEVRDDTGSKVTLPAPARRIVSLAPHLTELLFAIGAGSHVVGVAEYSDYPFEARALPRVGGGHGLDLERIAALHPDLAVAWDSGNNPRQLAAIERLGLPVFRSEPRSFEDIALTLERLGRLTGQENLATVQASRLRERVATLHALYAARAPVRVFYQVWNQPLMTVGGGHLISQAISLCGGVNVFAMLDSLAPTVDKEAAVAADPEIIILTAPLDDKARIPEDMGFWLQWPRVAAVRHRQIVRIDPALLARATPRLLDGTEQLCKAIDAARAKQ